MASLPPRWLWPRTGWGQVLFVSALVLPLVFIVVDEGEFEPSMSIVPLVTLALILFWRGVWVMVARRARASATSLLSTEEGANPAAPATAAAPMSEADVARNRRWTFASVVGVVIVLGLARQCAEEIARALR